MESVHPFSAWHQAVLYLPVITTILSIVFCTVLVRRYREKGGGPHLLWWGFGMATFGIGTFTEAFTSLIGWDPTVFRVWYVAGAFLGGYPLAQGSIYLLMNRRFAKTSAIVVSSLIAIGAVLVFLAPLDVSLAETHRLSGKVLGWQWLRAISPLINLYSLVFLVGGAVLSALRYRKDVTQRDRFLGNLFIAIGGLLPGIGGTFTRFGVVEALYITELIGLSLIFLGYRRCTRGPSPQFAPRSHAMPSLATLALLLSILLLAPAQPVLAEEVAKKDAQKADPVDEALVDGYFFAATTVTATGDKRDAFEVATPVTVINEQELSRQQVDNPAELLRSQPGVDVNGVGPNQVRPIIRGQRGLRVLFLENGLRMNNPRRQTDFGEITGLVDLDSIGQIEVVRGPASVLYGSDAIGGVLNVVTRQASTGAGDYFSVLADVRHASEGNQRRGYLGLQGRQGSFGFRLGTSQRKVDDYEAPAGSFGNIRLAQDTTVLDSGVDDKSFFGTLSYDFAPSHTAGLRFNRYRAEQTGFGYVDPAAYGAVEEAQIRILYPFQDYDRFTFFYNGSAFDSLLADSMDFQAYWQTNERRLVNDIFIDIGPIFPGAPNSDVAALTNNFTDLESFGVRAEVIKAAGDRHLLTYGFENTRDDSFNTDFSTTTTSIRFPFPPFQVVDVSTDSIANTPNAKQNSWGVFLQDEIAVHDRVRVTAGVRYQNVDTKAEATPGWDLTGLDFGDDQVVGSISATYQVNESINFLASWGSAFRSPNIVERLFNGLTPEGAGYQILNTDLTSERSNNWDLGMKYRRANAFMELVLFRTDISDGIVQYYLSAAERDALPAAVRDEIEALRPDFVVQQRNTDRLRYQGVEVALGYRSSNGWVFGGNYTYLDGERIDSDNPPTGDTVGNKANAYVRYQDKKGRFWAEYRVRSNGSERANLDVDAPIPPVGEKLPGFTVHTVAGGFDFATVGSRYLPTLLVTLDNLTNELYAEFSNSSFFRPEKGRNLTTSLRFRF